MVETYTRTRSKSASRKRRSRSGSKTKPIILPREKKSPDTDTNGKGSDSDSFHVTRRITRQSKLLVVSLNDFDDQDDKLEVESKNVEKTKKIKPETHDIKPKKNDISHGTFKNSIGKLILSLLIFALLPIVFALNKMCENGRKIRYLSLKEFKLEYFYHYKSIGQVVLYLSYLVILAIVPIGRIIYSTTNDGKNVKYRCNGIWCLIISIVVMLSLIYTNNFNTKIITDNYYFLIGSSITVALFISFVMHMKSYYHDKPKSKLNPGNFLYGFMMGREINPRVFGFDIKFFYESRLGFTSWALLNIVFCHQDLLDNDFKTINFSLLLCAVCQIVYCFDALIFEGDIIPKSFMVSGRFGFVHCFGNQVIVPFIFTLTTRAIQLNKFQLPWEFLIGIFIINLIGLVIYRTSNIQKSSFRKDPYSVHLSHLKTLTNRHGHQILVGGWWGWLRHPNYLGEILMCISWSLFSGIHIPICWTYPILFLFFIFVRCIENERECSLEHGSTWNEYKKYVPYRLIPFVF